MDIPLASFCLELVAFPHDPIHLPRDTGSTPSILALFFGMEFLFAQECMRISSDASPNFKSKHLPGAVLWQVPSEMATGVFGIDQDRITYQTRSCGEVQPPIPTPRPMISAWHKFVLTFKPQSQEDCLLWVEGHCQLLILQETVGTWHEG